MMPRLTFLSHFVLTLALIAAAILAWIQGAPQAIWATDLSYTTSVIAGLVVFSALYLGWQAWSVGPNTSVAFGLYATGICPLIGLFGTATGLRANIVALTVGSSGLAPLGTSLVTMQMGVLGALILGALVFNLQVGVGRYEEA